MLVSRGPFSDAPPEAQSRVDRNPTLLYSWFCTIFAITIVVFRVAGRLIRNNRMFREDTIMTLSLIPLLIRMAFVHVVLVYDTNNAQTVGLSEEDTYRRSIGSRMVLGSRIFYALFIWTAKFTVSEFLKRMTSTIWKKSYERILHSIRIFLVATFFIVIIATLAECQPFTHYWQVIPDPGPRCRQGYAQLITMGVCDMITDIVLVVFPIPLIIKSRMPLKRKISLVILFSMSIILIAITAYRIPAVIRHNGRQQYRTVWASSEIVAAAAISNAVVLGSFLRDRGVKKTKYKFGSASESAETRRRSVRQSTITHRQWGSDEDLVAGLGGYRLPEELHDSHFVPHAPSVASPAQPPPTTSGPFKSWNYHNAQSNRESDDSVDLKASMHSPVDPNHSDPTARPLLDLTSPSERTRQPSFFDVGGLLDTGPEPSRSRRTSHTSPIAHDFALGKKPSSRALLDLGGLLNKYPPTASASHSSIELANRPKSDKRANRSLSRSRSRSQGASRRLAGGKHRDASQDEPVPPSGIPHPTLRREATVRDLQDVGGLLDGGETGESSTVPPNHHARTNAQ
ncbi:hypothetical protein P152DRAFT_404953 [Eremomyces bilateralis CBS 781.70]|uniref:Rhodopsin domain-containing protein n=1 Tax=Eremomyces bilateralis CBS 781.70 TaxID=1392243 RepID=A0A6G1FSL2_9PEZI|nr:uncharacterized protein P152DRAFT_404953 [Eremomyces bilateralis CBS 781.70]KAF1808710.1 hypothetical protein P152DRAFT_404953 [Eremomyces bilateralis CBS 781.70]